MLMVINRVSAISDLGGKGFVKVRSFNRVIFSQGVAFVTIPEENSSQVRMVLKGDPEKIVDLSLQPVGRLPDRFNAHRRFAQFDPCLQPQSIVGLEGIEEIDHFKARALWKTVHPAEI